MLLLDYSYRWIRWKHLATEMAIKKKGPTLTLLTDK